MPVGKSPYTSCVFNASIAFPETLTFYPLTDEASNVAKECFCSPESTTLARSFRLAALLRTCLETHCNVPCTQTVCGEEVPARPAHDSCVVDDKMVVLQSDPVLSGHMRHVEYLHFLK